MPGAATQIFSREFDSELERIPDRVKTVILERITEMGHRLGTFPHHRLTGRAEYRLRVGDYRVIYQFEIEKGEVYLITLGHRREVYR